MATMRSKLLFLLFSLACFCTPTEAQDNDPEARRLFEQIYQSVFGPQGSTLHYKVNLIGIYKTEGTIWYKEKKSRFTDERVDTWNDGQTVYSVNRKKKVVNIYSAASNDYDKYASKFKFSLDDFCYTMERKSEGIWFTLRQRSGAKGTVKLVKALVNSETLVPIHLKIKVIFFWANISISNFRSGDVSDEEFQFPFVRYVQGYRFLDHR